MPAFLKRVVQLLVGAPVDEIRHLFGTWVTLNRYCVDLNPFSLLEQPEEIPVGRTVISNHRQNVRLRRPRPVHHTESRELTTI